MSVDSRLESVVRFYENLGPRSIMEELPAIYAPDALFKDPFNEVRGVEPIARIFTHMFEQVHEPRFVVVGRVAQGTEAFLTWEFHFRMKRFSNAPQCIRGATHLRFGPGGKVVLHRDYWDAAEELYEKLPLLGSLMRVLKRRAAR